MSSVAGLLLAAGSGRRLGHPKALVAFDGELLVERGVRLLTASGCQPVVVILGAGAAHVRRHAQLGEAQAVENHAWAQGMGTSLRTGLAMVTDMPERPEAVVVSLVDQPGITPAAVCRLIAAWKDGTAIAVAAFHGRRGNPVLLDRSMWPAAAESAQGDRGARDLLQTRPDKVQLVPCEDVANPHDIDTPDDLSAARAAPHY